MRINSIVHVLILGLLGLSTLVLSNSDVNKNLFTEYAWSQDEVMSSQDTLKLLEKIQQDQTFSEGFRSPLDKIINAYRKFNHGNKTSAELLPEIKIKWVFTRDLVGLFTIIINPRPHNDRKPSVLIRSPYGPTSSNLADIYLLDGYVAILQDQRGAFLSGGFWDFWRKDSQDAYDVMEWISKQDWSNGEVYTAGISADGNSALTQPLFNPPQLKGQFIVWASGEAYETAYQGGAFRQSLLEGWLTFIGILTRFHSLTVIDDIKKHESKDSYWDTLSLKDNNGYKNVNYTSVFWAGWFDIFQGPNIDAFNGYQTEGNPAIRGSNYLYVGPAGHCVGLGDASFPGSTTFLPIQLSREVFRGETNGKAQSSTDKITLYVMGTPLRNQVVPGDLGNYWTSLPTWPKATPTSYYFGPSKYLSTTSPSLSNSFESYLYDPRNPLPTQGGTNLSPPCGPKDLEKIESRSDVLVFTTPVLTKPVAVVGKVEAVLYVSSDAIDTDFTVFVSDVHPDNSSILLQDGIIRMRWRDGNVTPVYMTKGVVYEVKVDLWYTAKIFNAGHKIRVLVSSSNEPHFSVNRNNGEFVRDGGDYIKAINSVYHSAEFPSRVVFPVVDITSIPENPEIARTFAVNI